MALKSLIQFLRYSGLVTIVINNIKGMLIDQSKNKNVFVCVESFAHRMKAGWPPEEEPPRSRPS